jgi:hypothetical protein
MNEMVPVADLVALNSALRKGNIGYQTPTVPSAESSDSLSPLVPQSIESSLASATYTMTELAIWPDMPKRQVTNNVHEFNVLNDHGLDLDPFIVEGGGGTTNRSEYSRESIKIKYLAERREVSDVATTVGILGSSPNAIAEETERGTMRLMQKLERSILHAQEGLSSDSRQFDGIIKQIEDAGQVTDMRNGGITANKLQEVLADVYAASSSGKGFGRPDTIYVEPRVHGDLIKQTVAYGRHDQLQVSDSSLLFGHRDLTIMAPYGAVKVKAAPFLFTSYTAPATASGTTDAPSTPSFAQQPVHDSGLSGTSQWTAADAGDYIYKVVAVNKFGYSLFFTSNAVAVTSGNKVEMSVTADSDVDFYRVYRSAKDGAASTCKLIKEIANNTDLGSNCLITDLNDDIPDTSRVLFLQNDPSVIEFVRLLDFLRRPLAEIATTKPFLLMLFGSPIVKVPTKNFSLKNVGISAA